MSEDVFTETKGDSSGSYLEKLVGEGKKFSDPEALARGKAEADAFIEQLKREKQEAMDALAKAEGDTKSQATVADLIAEVRKAQEGNSDNNQMSEDDLVTKVRDIMRGESAQATAKQNRDKGNELVLQKVGGDINAAKTYVAERAKQLGMSPAKLAELSEVSPSAFAKLIDTDTSTATKGTTAIPSSNSSNFNQNSPQLEIDGYKTKAWFDNQRKELGVSKYLNNHKLQNDYLKSAMALGDRFK